MLSTMLNPLERHIGAGRGVMHGMKEVRRGTSYAVHSRLGTMRKVIGGGLMIWFNPLYTCTFIYLAGVSGINPIPLLSTSSSSSSSSSVITINSPRSSSGSGDSTTRPPTGVSETRLTADIGMFSIRLVDGVSAMKVGRKRSPLDGSS
jgi:hypothetical protein